MNNTEKSLFHSIEDSLTINREVLMGIGIIMVVFYHYNTGFWFQKLFYPGFLGVDVFLFISGYGLCRSLKNNNIFTFYKRRITRILPMFFLLAIVKCSLYVLNGGYLSLSDWVLSLTTVGYWVNGGIFVDWYLCGLFALYVFFPVLFRLPTLGGAILCIAACCISVCFNLEWYHQCLLLRLPIFYLGICCYKFNCAETFKRALLLFTLGFVAFAVLWLKGTAHTYSIIYPFAPFVILAISWLLSKRNRNYSMLRWFGKNSIEIYVTNCIVMRLIAYDLTIMPSVMYFILLFVLTPIIIQINKKCFLSLLR